MLKDVIIMGNRERKMKRDKKIGWKDRDKKEFPNTRSSTKPYSKFRDNDDRPRRSFTTNRDEKPRFNRRDDDDRPRFTSREDKPRFGKRDDYKPRHSFGRDTDSKRSFKSEGFRERSDRSFSRDSDRPRSFNRDFDKPKIFNKERSFGNKNEEREWKGRPRDKYFRDKAIETGEFRKKPARTFESKPFKPFERKFDDRFEKSFDKPAKRFESTKSEKSFKTFEDKKFDKPFEKSFDSSIDKFEPIPLFKDKEKTKFEFNTENKDETFGNIVINKGRLYSISKDNLKWYGEIVKKEKDHYLREWDIRKSKIGAAIKKGFRFNLTDKNVLYLGCSSGTTVSHLSDLTDKEIIGVDIAPIVMREFLLLAEKRDNIIPLIYDAQKLPDAEVLKGQQYNIIFEDIAQRNMIEIFIDNFKKFGNPNSEGWISLKTRSIDSTISAKAVLELSREKLEKSGLKIKKVYDLEPFEKEHYFIVVGF